MLDLIGDSNDRPFWRNGYIGASTVEFDTDTADPERMCAEPSVGVVELSSDVGGGATGLRAEGVSESPRAGSFGTLCVSRSLGSSKGLKPESGVPRDFELGEAWD